MSKVKKYFMLACLGNKFAAIRFFEYCTIKAWFFKQGVFYIP